MPSTSDQPDYQPFTTLDSDRQHPRVGNGREFSEELAERLVGVLDQPPFDDRSLIVDHAHTMTC